MTSAISAVDKKRKSWISDDDVSSDVITITFGLTSRWVNQSQATVYPVASYSVLHIQSTRKADVVKSCNPGANNPDAGNPDAGKADVAKSCNPGAKNPGAKNPVDKEFIRKEAKGNIQSQYLKIQPVAKQLTNYTNAGCQLLSLFQMLKTTKPAKERTQGLFHVGTLQNIFQTGRICVQRIEFEQRLIYEKNAIEEVAEK
ncbi:hypothetical protein F511_20871 [Dorcoceras hygrometricum]|uniref:Uncharacterized protein n=1 Tax=Dorcoceras hygrometricum TaxID=472368 RepID=A0A2Z7B907_9LAMI|nr:hypothetical protein F511_20871 [Dorcoceras hygrometricum]